MQSACPKLTTRWVVMGVVSKWLLEKRVHLFQHIEEKQPSQAPPDWWWVVIAAISALADHVNIAFIKLQAPDLLVTQQKTVLENLAITICCQFSVERPHSPHQNEIRVGMITYGRFSVYHHNVIDFIYDQGTFIRDIFNSLSSEMQDKVITEVGMMTCQVVDGILAIQAERDFINQPDDDLPAVRPHELVQIRE